MSEIYRLGIGKDKVNELWIIRDEWCSEPSTVYKLFYIVAKCKWFRMKNFILTFIWPISFRKLIQCSDFWRESVRILRTWKHWHAFIMHLLALTCNTQMLSGARLMMLIVTKLNQCEDNLWCRHWNKQWIKRDTARFATLRTR